MDAIKCFHKGQQAEAEGDFKNAAVWYRVAADLGHVDAQVCIGNLYFAGKGVIRDYDIASRYFRRAASNNSGEGHARLADLYAAGHGVDKDMALAIEHFRIAAELGHTRSMTNYGGMLIQGAGVPQDQKRGAALLRKAADAGDITATVALGMCFRDGIGVEKDLAKALACCQKGAAAEDPTAQRLVGEIELELDGARGSATGFDTEPEFEPDPEPSPELSAQNLEAAIAKLNSLIGLDGVKEQVNRYVNRTKVNQARKARGMSVPETTNHCVFTGNPGTGKTTVARIMADIYKELGIVSNGHLVETDRSGLVGEYVGHTAAKTRAVIEEALGGVLFIDEAYTLVGKGKTDFGTEAIETLLKMMEDNRHDLVVIAAGYKREMEDFIRANPGLESRFQNFIEFEDYKPDELVAIFQTLCRKHGFTLADDALESLSSIFEDMVATKDETFANGREARKLFDCMVEIQADRIVEQHGALDNITQEELALVTADDIARLRDRWEHGR